MTLTEAIEVLEYHNKWRKGAEIEQTCPKKLTEAINLTLDSIKALRDNNLFDCPTQYKEGCNCTDECGKGNKNPICNWLKSLKLQ